MTETDLIKGCLKNDPHCQKTMVAQYGPFLMSVCRRYAPASHHAEDLLQETFISIFRFIKAFDNQKGSFKGWIKKIAINTSLKYLAKIKIKAEHIDDSLLETTQPLVFSHLATNEIIALIELLPDGYKQIFNMYIIEGYDHNDIADLLGIKASTSRSNLTRAKKILRDKILLQKDTKQWIKIG